MATPYDLNLQRGIWPGIVRLGQALSRLLPVRGTRRIFFFFPYCHVGGAERVHADVANCLPQGSSPLIFFTHRSRDEKMLAEFQRAGRCLKGWALYKYLLPFAVGVVSGVVNRQENAVVFGCNSRFFYKMLPFLSARVKKIDLMHAFGGGSEDFSLEAVPYLDKRVVINRKTIHDFELQYHSNGVPPAYLERMVLIENAVPVPAQFPVKPRKERLQVLYVGRGSEEKRVHLVGKAASLCAAHGIPADFLLAGDVEDAVAEADRHACTFAGEVTDRERMAALYADADLIVLTSSREGFPMVIMEAMAYGVVPLATAVGGIPEHVTDGRNGFLFTPDETGLPELLCHTIRQLAGRREVLEGMSRVCYEYARENFSQEEFCRKYRELLAC